MRRSFKISKCRGALCVALLAALVSSCLQLPTALGDVPATDIDWHTLDWNGLERVYGVYVPMAILDPAPLVFLLHGGGGSASKTWTQEHGRSWRALADEHDLVLVLPEGRLDPGDDNAHHWNDCRTDLDPAVIATTEDDVGFILELIEEVSAITAIDSSRVYVTGASNGGMMTYRLAIEAGDVFAAAAAIIANLPDPSECRQPASPIPMLIMNGSEDLIMPFDGGCVANDKCRRGQVMSTADTIAFWIDANGATPEPTIKKLANRAWFDRSTVTVYSFEGGREGSNVVYYHIKGGGHNVPGFEADSLAVRALAGPKNREIDGSTEVWAFFQQY
jgi:polyhydroxybutyrate depolymerase